MTTRTDALHDALERLRGYSYFDGVGLACHGPMAAEALSNLGYDAEVARWVEAYKAVHAPLDATPTREQLDPGDEGSWRPALGDLGRVTDWADLFVRQLAEEDWERVLVRWAPLLLPGYAGALTHGLIRTAHAVRAIGNEARPSDLARDELAHGLALWAATFVELPGRPQLHGPLGLHEAIERLPRPADAWAELEAGLFVRMHELAEFPAAVEALGPPVSLDDALSDLSAAFCTVLVANAGVFPVPLVHTITPISAMRTLAPYLAGQSVEGLYRLLWHVGSAIVIGFTPPPGNDLFVVEADDVPDRATIAGQAAEHGDPHAVKIAEACLSEHWLRPDPIYLLAARSVLARTTSLFALAGSR